MPAAQEPALVTHPMNYANHSLQISNFASDELINHSLVTDGSWEPWQLNLMSRVIKPHFTCVDIGANVGINALFVSRCAPQGRVFAFEPFDVIYRVLTHNVEQNRATNITTINKGISSTTRTLNMLVDMKGVGGAHIADEQINTGTQVSGTFKFARLDEEMAAAGVTSIDFMKMDVEGHELQALSSAQQFLKNPNLQFVMEYNPLLLRSADKTTDAFYDRTLFELLKSNFRYVLFMGRDSKLFDLPDYHTLRQCMMGKYFVDDLYCTNWIRDEVADLMTTQLPLTVGIPVTHSMSNTFTATFINRGPDGWTCADSHSPATAGINLAAKPYQTVTLKLDAMHSKHLEDASITSWPVNVLIGDVAVTLDLLNTPRELQIGCGPTPPAITIESVRSAPASTYLGNPDDTRRVGFKFDVV